MTNREQQNSDDRRLEAWLGSMPVLPPSQEFVDGVMRAVRNPQRNPQRNAQRSWQQRVWDFCFAPRLVQFNFAGAAALTLMLAVGSAWMLWERQSSPADLLAARGEGAIKVRFSLDMSGAQRVAVVGDFTRWQKQVPLRRAADGGWIAEIPLPPGDYEYMFVIDGAQWVSDPRARRYRADGFGNKNAVVTVPSI